MPPQDIRDAESLSQQIARLQSQLKAADETFVHLKTIAGWLDKTATRLVGRLKPDTPYDLTTDINSVRANVTSLLGKLSVTPHRVGYYSHHKEPHIALIDFLYRCEGHRAMASEAVERVMEGGFLTEPRDGASKEETPEKRLGFTRRSLYDSLRKNQSYFSLSGKLKQRDGVCIVDAVVVLTDVGEVVGKTLQRADK